MVEVTSLDYGNDRAKNLLMEAFHIFSYIRIDMWPHVDTLAGISMEIVRFVVIRYTPLAPDLRCSAGLAHIDSLEEVNSILLRQH